MRFPIDSIHTRPIVRGIARATAKCNALADALNNVTLTDRQVCNDARRAFKTFCASQADDRLTDNPALLRAMYEGAYVEAYTTEYPLIVASLDAIVEEDELVMSLISGLDCIDSL